MIFSGKRAYNIVIQMPARGPKLIAFRIDADLLARLEQSATEDDRSLSYQIRKALGAWLETRGADAGRPKAKQAKSRKPASTS